MSEEESLLEEERSYGCEGMESEGNVQLLTFCLGEELFAVNLTDIKEIKTWQDATRVPNTEGSALGVINLRGAIVPLFDLRAKFSNGRTKPTDKHVVLVVFKGNKINGILVDAVADIANIDEDKIYPPPCGYDSKASAEYIKGLVDHKGNMVTILNTEILFSDSKE